MHTAHEQCRRLGGRMVVIVVCGLLVTAALVGAVRLGIGVRRSGARSTPAGGTADAAVHRAGA
ncbi:hypothetical protein AB0D59_39980 [Streptomyces sp. NPDC048417]|uniref:hypothetical protein n=1 Tax=Streptomyces sp. NPDC048417 TaxID=3155387 RepID=UPI003426B473